MVNQPITLGSRAVAAAVLVLAFLCAQPAFAQQPDAATNDGRESGHESKTALEERLIFLLSAYHGRPTRAQLDELGEPDVVAALLREIASQKSARPSMRLRAVDTLGHFADGASVAFLQRIVEVPDALEVRRPGHAKLLRQHAMISFARLRQEAAVPTLLPLIDADDLQTRLSAVSALGRFGGEAGRVELERLRRRVDHPAMERSLKKFVGDSSNK